LANGFRIKLRSSGGTMSTTSAETLGLSAFPLGATSFLWSHYTRGHTGLAMGFNTADPIFQDGPTLLSVEYRKHRSILDYPPKRHDPRLGQQIRSLIRRKSAEWKYEGEWRQQHLLANCSRICDDPAQPTKANYYFPISASCISEVILGCRCEDPDVHMILKNERFQHVHLLRCVQDESDFRLHIVDEYQRTS
jgi:DUF2971 family protein